MVAAGQSLNARIEHSRSVGVASSEVEIEMRLAAVEEIEDPVEGSCSFPAFS